MQNCLLLPAQPRSSMISMYDMAVRMGGERSVDQDYYGVFANIVPGYYIPDYTVYQPTYLPQNSRSWNTFDHNHHYALPYNQMSSTKTGFFSLDCPELTNYDAVTSPTSSFISAGPFAPPSSSQDTKIFQPSGYGLMGGPFAQGAPSPSQDAKPLQPNEYGLMDGSFAHSGPSPSSISSDGTYYTALSPTWSTPSTTLGSDMWNGSLYSANQLLESPLQSTNTTMASQNSFDGFTAFDGPFYKASSTVTEPGSLTGYVGDGLVVPGYLSLDPSLPASNTEVSADPVQTGHPGHPGHPGHTRSEQDDFIQDARRRGLSYKEIKRRGGFTEAESTLRGRHRILSKPKEMRVRKPQWSTRDVMILRQAVDCFANNPRGRSATASPRVRHFRRDRTSSRLPWKKIAECIQASGASYPFAGAACAKKWDEIRNSS